MATRDLDPSIAWQGTESGDAEPAWQPTVSPGKRSLTMNLAPRAIMRKGDGVIESAHAASVLDDVEQRSTGHALDQTTRQSMESGFGQSFADVRVHTGNAAATAAKNLNAKAFTVGHDVYFNKNAYAPDSSSGKQLLAHELAHVAQNAHGAASPTGSGPTVSHPGDAAERAADEAADAVMRGDTVAGLGGAPATVIHRDGLDDVRSESDGNWLGQVNGAEVLTRVRALNAADKEALVNDHDLMRKVVSGLNAAQILELYTIVVIEFRWRIYYLANADKLGELVQDQWRWLIGYASPQEMQSLRTNYPYGYQQFLQHAPASLIPSWDKLAGLKDGSWTGQPEDVRNAVNELNAAQQTTARDDQAMMRAIMQHCGDAREKFRTLQYLAMPIKWQVYWLNDAGVIAEINDQEWAQALTEGGKQEFDELVGWADMWTLAQANIPASVLQVARSQTNDPETTATSLDDAVQITTLFNTLGAAGFLAVATQTPDPTELDENYVKIEAAGKVIPTIDGLELGPKMGTRTAANLKKWFDTASATDVPTLEKMFQQRFRIQVTGAGSYAHPATTSWTKEGLRQAWQTCEALPPSAVEGNERLYHMLRDPNRGPGSAYYAGPDNGATGDVLMGYRNDGELNNQVGGSNDWIYQAGGTGPGSPAANVRVFNATMRHELGHAVDAALGIMDGWGRQDAAGNWAHYGSYTEFVDAIITAAGGMSGHGYPDEAQYRQAMINATTNGQTFSAALTALGGAAPAAPPGGPVDVVWTPSQYREPPGGGNGPWYSQSWNTVNDRNFQDSYAHPSSLYSFKASVRTQRMVTDYQWRAPGEWFAEVYQVYYSEQENDPNAAVGGRLRSKDPEAANMVSNLCDRGHSPQQMAGGGSAVDAPGTGTNQ